jgi:hypothetical protein
MITPLPYLAAENGLGMFKMTDIQRLQEENKKLKLDIEMLEFKEVMAAPILKENIELKKENRDLKIALDEANENILYERIEILEGENEKLKEFYIGLSAEHYQLKEQLQQAQNEKPAAIVGTRYCLKCGIESSYYFIDGFCNPCKECGVKLDKKPERKPHKCPVCDGIDQIQIYDGIKNIYVIATPDCKSCNATGIVWEPK